MVTNKRIFFIGAEDRTDVENPVDNVESPSAPGEMAVESSVEKVDKKLHRGCQNNQHGWRAAELFSAVPPAFCRRGCGGLQGRPAAARQASAHEKGTAAGRPYRFAYSRLQMARAA